MDKDDYYTLSIIKHNIITDTYSENIIRNEFEKMYYDHKYTTYSNVNNSYLNYIENVANNFNNNIVSYWKNKLSNITTLNLPTERNTNNGIIVKTIKTPKLNEFIKQTKTTKYIVLLTVFNILLSRYNLEQTENSDISIETQIADRFDPLWKNAVGFMVSTLIIRNKFNNGITVSELIKEITLTLHEAIDNRYITYDKLLAICKSKINIMFVMQEFDTKMKLQDVNVNQIDVYIENKSVSLYVDIYDDNDKQKIQGDKYGSIKNKDNDSNDDTKKSYNNNT
jgi:hypothetical protein